MHLYMSTFAVENLIDFGTLLNTSELNVNNYVDSTENALIKKFNERIADIVLKLSHEKSKITISNYIYSLIPIALSIVLHRLIFKFTKKDILVEYLDSLNSKKKEIMKNVIKTIEEEKRKLKLDNKRSVDYNKLIIKKRDVTTTLVNTYKDINYSNFSIKKSIYFDIALSILLIRIYITTSTDSRTLKSIDEEIKQFLEVAYNNM